MPGLIHEKFPLFCCGTVDDNHILVGGGGGAAKTGVRNAIDVLQIIKVKKQVLADSSSLTFTGDEAAMNMDVVQTTESSSPQVALAAVGLGGSCALFSIRKTKGKQENTTDNKSEGLRKRTNKKSESKNENDAVDVYTSEKLIEIQTDFSSDPYQKSVRISPNTLFFATGGSDGFVRAWQTNNGGKIFAVKGHKEDVTDIDISPDNKKIVTVSREGTACEWDAKNGHKIVDLHAMWNAKMVTREYKFKFCRYGKVPNKETYVLFTAHAPKKRDNKLYCDVTKWSRRRQDGVENDNDPWRPAMLQRTGKVELSAFAISDDGIFLGLGFMDGSVSIYISFSLQCARTVTNVHSIFVTGLTFVNGTDRALEAIGDYDAAVLSVSADNNVNITTLSSRTSYSGFLAIILCFLIIVGAAFVLVQLEYI